MIKRGVRNTDGWGIASWSVGALETVRSNAPAFADRQFAETTEAATGEAVIAHVRAATLGRVAESDHPSVQIRALGPHP